MVLNSSEASVIHARCVVQKSILDRIIIKLVEIRANPELWAKFVKNLVDFSVHYSVAGYLGAC